MKYADTDLIESPNFFHNIRLGKKEIDGRFVIPSGIRCTNVSTINDIFERIPEVGIITTKSISIFPKTGYKEPIYAKYSKDSYINAVGLSNPGANAFAEEIKNLRVPKNKFLLISIFGGDVKEFADAAKALDPFADGFELNMSCPHAAGYGIEIGQDRKLVTEITKEISLTTSKLIIVKLSSTCPQIEKIAQAAIGSGAAGISAINTVGPSLVYLEDTPVLSNKVGGLSGEGIRPLGLNSIRKIRKEIGSKPIIIGMGGILNKDHIKQYYFSGADFFGIGSALTGMKTAQAKHYFKLLKTDLFDRQNRAKKYQNTKIPINMDYYKTTVAQISNLTDRHFKIQLNDHKNVLLKFDSTAKFYFLAIPGIGEKPFALFSSEEKSFIIQKVGFFTNFLSRLHKGDKIFFRGPYGSPIPAFKNKHVFLIGGGYGTIPLYEIGKKLKRTNKIFQLFGYKNVEDIFEIERFNKLGKVEIITEDGLSNHKGFVTDLLNRDFIPSSLRKNQIVFINSGPEKMVKKCFEIQKTISSLPNIWGSISYLTTCGVGICGKCSTDKGLLSCVDGPFLNIKNFA